MTNQPGLKIIAQGVTPEWFPKVLPALEELRSKKKQKPQHTAERLDFITPEKVLKHFSAAEMAGTWSRQGQRTRKHQEE